MLTTNMILWGQDVHPVDDTEGSDVEKLTRMTKRLEDSKAHACKYWKREYVHSLMESHQLNIEKRSTPKVGENCAEWKKGKVAHFKGAVSCYCTIALKSLKLPMHQWKP